MSSKKPESSISATLARLTEALHAPEIGLGRQTAVAIALSGGLDSTVLLHAVQKLLPVRSLRALHIDHGLRPESRDWAECCRAATAMLGVAFVARRVEIRREPAQSLEEAARRARYAALAELVEPDEVLLTAHHADDQLETLLYRVLRGTGVRGLRGIAERDVFGRGFVARPLLALTRADIRAAALHWGLRWVEDPSNEDARFDRNYIRADVVPALLARWPQAARTAQRLARAARDAEQIQEAMARQDLAASGTPERLALAALRALPLARQRNVLRYAARALALGVPDARHLARLLALLGGAARSACVQWPGGEARTFRDQFFLMPPLASPAPALRERLRTGVSVKLERGWLTLAPVAGSGLPDAWVKRGLQLTSRQGGERFWPHGRVRDRSLSRWFHEHAVVPWMRDRIPLIRHGDDIVAIGDLAVSELAVRVRGSRANWGIVWRDRPALR